MASVLTLVEEPTAAAIAAAVAAAADPVVGQQCRSRRWSSIETTRIGAHTAWYERNEQRCFLFVSHYVCVYVRVRVCAVCEEDIRDFRTRSDVHR